MIFSAKLLKISFLLSFTILFYSLLQAQSQAGQAKTNTKLPKIGKVTGRVVDKTTGNSMEYVNILVVNSKNKEMIGGSITNAKGEFSISDLPMGEASVKISFIGFKDYVSANFSLTPKNPTHAMGTLHLEDESTSLEAVVIMGEKRTMEYKLDKKVVNVEQNIVSSGGTAVDVLQNVPSINVDNDGNVSMKGSSNVTILIDGRPASLSDMGLDQIPASSIENIEIISNPSAKYNPEGMSGILNIKTKKRTINRDINGMLTLSASTASRYNASANINVGLGKVNLFSTLSGNYRMRGASGQVSTITEKGNPVYPFDNRTQEMGMSSRPTNYGRNP